MRRESSCSHNFHHHHHHQHQHHQIQGLNNITFKNAATTNSLLHRVWGLPAWIGRLYCQGALHPGRGKAAQAVLQHLLTTMQLGIAKLWSKTHLWLCHSIAAQTLLEWGVHTVLWGCLRRDMEHWLFTTNSRETSIFYVMGQQKVEFLKHLLSDCNIINYQEAYNVSSIKDLPLVPSHLLCVHRNHGERCAYFKCVRMYLHYIYR